MKPDISIVIPLYNKEQYVRRSIDSVLAQTFPDFECIVVDSSTDKSPGIVRQYRDSRIIHVPVEKSTAARARNSGVRMARADLVAFLDADDEWQPDHLETLSHLRKTFPDAGLYSTPYVKLRPDGRPMAMLFYGIPRPPWEGYIPRYLASCSRGDEPVHSSSCAVPRNVFDAMGGFPEDLVYGEDQFLWGKISLQYAVAYRWKGLAIYHTDAMGRICDEAHVIQEHPFSTYLRQELDGGRIPPEKAGECRSYIRRKWFSEKFASFLSRGRRDATGYSSPDTDARSLPDNVCRVPAGGTGFTGTALGRFYHSRFHDMVRRFLGILYGCYDPGEMIARDRK
jgi:glycosyltransferase involved in cell wall biosynthesis